MKKRAVIFIAQQQQRNRKQYYEKSLCLVNLCSQMDCFSMHASVDKEDMSLSFTVVSKREEEENIAFFFAKTYRENINRLLFDLLVFCSDKRQLHFHNLCR